MVWCLLLKMDHGIRINMSEATSAINSILQEMENKSSSSDLDALQTKLFEALKVLSDKTAYINLSKDDQHRPVMTFGSENSPFKVQITNEAINFLQRIPGGDDQIIAYANGQKFYNLRTVVQQDVQIGDGPGFIWKIRDSGNMGLTYIGKIT